MELKRNLMIGSHIFASGTPLDEIPEPYRSQIPANELEEPGEAPFPPPESKPPEMLTPSAIQHLKFNELSALCRERNITVPDGATRAIMIDLLLKAQG